MAAFQRITRMAITPVGAATAITLASSATATIASTATIATTSAGRQTTTRTTSHLSKAASRNLQTLLLRRSHHKNNNNNNNNNIHTMRTMSMKNTMDAAKMTNATNATNTTNTTSRNFTSASTKNTTKSKSFMEWYEAHLQSRPIPTKMVTGSILWGLGDAVAQIVPYTFFGDDDDNDNGHNSNSNSNSNNNSHDNHHKLKQLNYDSMRTARAMIFGFAIHAPLSHVHFNLLEWMTVKGGFTGLRITVFKTVMEQFVYWSWFSNTLYHGAMGAMQGMSTKQIYDRITHVLWDTQKAQWVFWIPVQLLNFRFVPVRHQLNVVLLTSVVWTALLSAWYPPGEDDNGDGGDGGDNVDGGDDDAVHGSKSDSNSDSNSDDVKKIPKGSKFEN